MQTFTIRDLRDRTGELVRDAEAGKLSLVTKHGHPVFVAVPFDEGLLKHGVATSLAVRLFDQEVIGLEGAARIAGLSQSELIDVLGEQGIPVLRFGPGELEAEIDEAIRIADRG